MARSNVGTTQQGVITVGGSSANPDPIKVPPKVVPKTSNTPTPVIPITPIILTPPLPPVVLVPPPITQQQITEYFYPPDLPAPTSSVGIVNELADALQKPPVSIDKTYADKMINAAAYLGVPVHIAPPVLPPETSATIIYAQQTNGYNTQADPNYTPSVIVPVIFVNNEYETTRAQQASSNILAFVQQTEDLANSIAASSDALLQPENPFALIAQLNKSRGDLFTPVSVNKSDADNIIYAISVYKNLVKSNNQSGMAVKNDVSLTSQFSHVSLSYNGLGGSGNTASDILQFLPTSDAVTAQNFVDTHSVTDFSKRVPHLLCTMEYTPDPTQNSKGTLLCWKKIADASGYVIKRRDVFSQRYVSNFIDNSEISSQSLAYLQYAKLFGLSFLNAFDDKSIVVFLDTNVTNDEYSLYTIQAYQTKNDQAGAIFSMPTSKIVLSSVNVASITNIAASNSGSLSAWQSISSFLYNGSTAFDWPLAAANIRASSDRNDNINDTRNYSYVNANIQFLLQQAMYGKLVKPTDASTIQKNIRDSLQKFGTTQTVQSLLDSTGVSYYFEGRDAIPDKHFDRVGTKTALNSNLFKAVGSAIDPTTAMLDMRSLASNIIKLVSNAMFSVITQPGSTNSATSGPAQIQVVPEDIAKNTSDTILSIQNRFVDLTTFDGISTLISTIGKLTGFGASNMTPQTSSTLVPLPPLLNIPVIPSIIQTVPPTVTQVTPPSINKINAYTSGSTI